MKKIEGILLIDDDDTNNFLNNRLLTRMQISDKIKEFRNGKQAFDYLYNISTGHYESGNPEYFKPALILLDINMPVMDGFEFIELFERLLNDSFKKDVVLALLTTSEHDQDTERAAASNIAYLTKPLTFEKVQNLLEQYF